MSHRRIRLEEERDRLQQDWETRNKKVKQISKKLAIETSAAEIFKLEQELQDEETKLERISNRLDEIERELNSLPPATIQQRNWSRRNVIKFAAWVLGIGSLGSALLISKLIPNPKKNPQPSPTSSNTNQASNTPTPTEKPAPDSTPSPSDNPNRGQPSLKTFEFKTVTVDVQGNITNRSPGEARYFAQDLGNGVTMKMVQIPGGTFTIGSPAEEKDRDEKDENSPQYEITVPRFFIGKYAVTQEQYQAIMGSNPAKFKGKTKPVESVNWYDAIEFCEKLRKQTGRNYRLPSEAEWEYACRAGTTTPFYFGETITTEYVNYNGKDNEYSPPEGEYREQTTNVGIFPPNAFGLYDMHGNVWELCEDVYHENYEGIPQDGKAWTSGSDSRKIYRGGSWLDLARLCRSAFRLEFGREIRKDNHGFRVVMEEYQ